MDEQKVGRVALVLHEKAEALIVLRTRVAANPDADDTLRTILCLCNDLIFTAEDHIEEAAHKPPVLRIVK